MTGGPAELVEALADLARAIFERRGEAATMDMTRAHPAPRRERRDEAAREGTI